MQSRVIASVMAKSVLHLSDPVWLLNLVPCNQGDSPSFSIRQLIISHSSSKFCIAHLKATAANSVQNVFVWYHWHGRAGTFFPVYSAFRAFPGPCKGLGMVLKAQNPSKWTLIRFGCNVRPAVPLMWARRQGRYSPLQLPQRGCWCRWSCLFAGILTEEQMTLEYTDPWWSTVSTDLSALEYCN